jgi:hypothetical protein
VGNWGTIEQKELTTIAQNTESLVEINFTPIQEKIRLKIRATDPNNGGAALNVTAVEGYCPQSCFCVFKKLSIWKLE